MPSGARTQLRNGWLPAETTEFVGRRRESAQIRQLLATARLVTLTGVGGSGKTRLALKIAADVRRSYRDGVWLVDLTTVPDQGLVAFAVAEALGLPYRGGGQQPGEAVVEHLRARELLLVVDNCEHLLDASARLIEAVLRAAPGVRVLCTSRQPLGTAGEHVWRVPPLPVPEKGAPVAPADGAEPTAVTLFAQRAAATYPGFRVTADNGERVVEICRRLDGLPLAVELAAAQLHTLSLDQLAAAVRDRLPAFAVRYAVPEHHRALSSTFDWSFDLCSTAERELWQQMSVFVDSVDLEAAQYVCGDGRPVLDAVCGLTEKSILIREEAVGQVRYRLLETVRQYGLCRLRAAGADVAALRRRHRDWYRQLARRLHEDWFSPRQDAWSIRLRREQANLRAALGFCLSDGDVDGALRLAADLRCHWLGGRAAAEGRYWLDRALAADCARGRADPSPARAMALATRSRVLNVLGDHEAAAASAAECLALARRLGDPLLVAYGLGEVGLCTVMTGAQLPTARAQLEDALTRFERADPLMTAVTMVSLALVHLYQGDVDRAAALCATAHALCRVHGDEWWLATTLVGSAVVELGRNEPAAAEVYLREALGLARPLGAGIGVAIAFDLVAAVAADRGDDERAATMLGAACASRRAIGQARFGTGRFQGHRDLARARAHAALGPDRFDAAYTKGMELPVDLAIVTAFGDPPATPAGPSSDPATLTPREYEVTALIAQGLSNRQIAGKLVVSQRTAESHVEHILGKLHFSSRAQVAAWYTARARGAGKATD